MTLDFGSGFRLCVLHATDGDAGEIAPGIPATRETLGSLRRDEDECTGDPVVLFERQQAWLASQGRLARPPAPRARGEFMTYFDDLD